MTQRIAFYSHDGFGLGHVRRNLLLAHALLAADPSLELCLITGSPRAFFFDVPSKLKVIKLPPVTKDQTGDYVSKDVLRPLARTLLKRKAILRKTLSEFRPDIFVVDHTPVGLCGELLPLLADLKQENRTKLVLGLRDILDTPEQVCSTWRRQGIPAILEEVYDHLLVYGAQKTFNIQKLYGLGEKAGQKLHYLGYLGRGIAGRTVEASATSFQENHQKHILCLVGGGGDGYPLAEAFVRLLLEKTTDLNGTLVTGPFLSHEKRANLARLCSGRGNIQVLRFTTQIESLMRSSDAVITMGGYNAVMECLSLGRKTLVVPRTVPRQEQLLRAIAFEKLGLVKTLSFQDLDHHRLQQKISELLAEPTPAKPELVLPMQGVAEFVSSIQEMLFSSSPQKCPSREEAIHVDNPLKRV